MSRVRLRSRNYKVSKSDISKLCNQFSQKRKLRNGILNSLDNGNLVTVNNKSVQAQSNIIDKSSESSSADTFSFTSQNLCKWDNCDFEYQLNSTRPIADQLEQHLLDYHVKSQMIAASNSRKQYFQCQWTNCKVYGCKSLSLAWLQRHVIEHTDNRTRPYPCVFELCYQRFSSVQMLERHVQTHVLWSELSGQFSSSATPNLSQKQRNNSHIQSLSSHLSSGGTIGAKLYSSSSANYPQKTYHVHRTDYLNQNSYLQFNRSSVIDGGGGGDGSGGDSLSSTDTRSTSSSSLSSDVNIINTTDRIDSSSLIKLCSVHFHIIGARSLSNGVAQSLVEYMPSSSKFVQSHPTHMSISQEWIDNATIEKAKDLLLN